MSDTTGSPARDTFSADAAAVRRLLRRASLASLATIDRSTGHPLASLVQLATLPDARPCFLISELAQHTRNLEADPRSSILVDDRMATPGLAAGRATLVGRAMRLEGAEAALARERFVARHPDAESYAAFADFSPWCLGIDRAHLVAGFGRIREVEGTNVVLADISDSGAAKILSQLQNALATELGQRGAKLIGWDCEGLDILGPNGPIRIEFGKPIPLEASVLDSALSALQQLV